MSPFELSNKIFTYDKKLQTGDLTKINEVQNQKLEGIIKRLKCMKGIEDDFIPKFSFFQFKKCRVYDSSNQSYKFMLCFTDISQKILYDTSKAEGELLSLINSTISHEMRNPLNSIINQCTIMESLLHSFRCLIEHVKKLGKSSLEDQFVEI